MKCCWLFMYKLILAVIQFTDAFDYIIYERWRRMFIIALMAVLAQLIRNCCSCIEYVVNPVYYVYIVYIYHVDAKTNYTLSKWFYVFWGYHFEVNLYLLYFIQSHSLFHLYLYLYLYFFRHFNWHQINYSNFPCEKIRCYCCCCLDHWFFSFVSKNYNP